MKQTIEKRYKYSKYVNCYCVRHEQILVGAKFYGVINPVGLIASTAFALWAATLNVELTVKLGAFAIFLLWVIGFYADYLMTKRIVLKARHSPHCSQKIACLAMIYGSLWAGFKIMQTKDDGKRSWQ